MEEQTKRETAQETYNVGDLIVYGNTGVCRVEEIAEKNLAGEHKGEYHYILAPLYQNYTISIPVHMNTVYMRRIITKEEALRLIDMVPTITAEAYHSPVLRELSDHYKETLDNHDCGELLELTMSIYAKRQELQEQNRKMVSVDERFMKQAEEMLHGELAAALEIEKEAVPDFIAARLEQGAK